MLSDVDDAGFSNFGYSGINPDDGNWTTGFYMKGDYQGSISIKIVGNSEGSIHGSTSLRVNSTASEFRYFESSFAVSGSYYPAHWELTFDESVDAEETFYFGLVQLWGVSERDRSVHLFIPHTEHGYTDSKASPPFMDGFIFSMYNNINPSFLHFPGGNNL